MKLALALKERSELATKIAELSKRLKANALVQDNEKPAEAPAELLCQLNDSLVRFEELTARVNHTNSVTQLKGQPITACIAKRDCLERRLSILRSFLGTASQRVDRRTAKEIKIRSTVSVPELRRQVDDCENKLRLLDQEIQEANWLTELI